MSKQKNNDIQDKYRRFSEEMDKFELPSEQELLDLIQQHDAAKADGKQVDFTPVHKETKTTKPLWRYAAAVLLLVFLGTAAWLVVWNSPFSSTPNNNSPSNNPAAGTITADNEDSFRQGISDSIPPETMPAHSEANSDANPLLLSQVNNDNTAKTRNQGQVATSTILPNMTCEEYIVIADDQTIPTDSTDSPALDNGHPSRLTIKDVDMKQDEVNDRRALHGDKKDKHRKRHKANIEKNDNRDKNINVIVPKQNTYKGYTNFPRPHYIPSANGNTRVIYY